MFSSRVDPRSHAATSAGEEFYHQRIGQMNLSCAHCHDANFALNANGLTRKARDCNTPVGRLANSFLDQSSAGIGGSVVGTRGYAGLGVSTLTNNYGIPTPEGAHIELEQTRIDAAGELSNPSGFFTKLRVKAGYNDYEHSEIESSGEVGTVFVNKAWDSRLELPHVPWTDGKGALGFQFQDREFPAIGEEAIVPKTDAKASAVFLVEQKKWTDWTVDGGLRFERETRKPEGDLPSRRFSLTTVSVGAIWKLSPAIELAVNATRGERAPSIEELYSRGAHVATATFDSGDPNLRKEASRNLDITLRGKLGASRWKVSAFAARVRDYVYTASQDSDGDGLADRYDEEGELSAEGEFLFQQTSQADARFHGLEAEWRYRPEGNGLGWRVFGDFVRGELTNGENLPRLSPSRIGAEVDARFGAWGGWVSAMRIDKQTRTAPLETATPGFTRVDAEVSYTFDKTPLGSLTAYLQASNLLDEEMRVHTSYIKEFAPLMGRSYLLGVRGTF